jgi:flagellar hook-associated protein 1 FlgK
MYIEQSIKDNIYGVEKMRSTFSGLNTMVRGLYSQQVSLDTVGHNITNSSTDGYSRQRVNLATTNPETVYGSKGQMQVGTGVDAVSVTRARDTFVDQQMWKEVARKANASTATDALKRIEDVFHEPTMDSVQTGLQGVLNQFWQSLQDLASDASNDSERKVVRQRGVEVANTIKQSETQLRDLIKDTNSAIGIKVQSVNQITSELVSLN